MLIAHIDVFPNKYEYEALRMMHYLLSFVTKFQ